MAEGYLAQTPINVVLGFKRIVRAFQNIQNFEDRSSTARDIFILVRRLRDFRSYLRDIFILVRAEVDFWLQNQAKSAIQRQGRIFFRIEKKIKILFSQMCPKFVLGCLELPVTPSRGLCGALGHRGRALPNTQCAQKFSFFCFFFDEFPSLTLV